MACTPGGEARALPLFPLIVLAVRFSAFSVSFPSSFFSLSFLLFFIFFFFHSPAKERMRGGGRRGGRRLREITRPPWAPARPSRAAFSRNSLIGLRVHGSFICILRFFVVKLTRRLPFSTMTFSRICIVFLSLFLLYSNRVSLVSRQPGPPTQKTVDVFAKYREVWKLMRDRLSSDRSRLAAVSN